MKFLILGSNGMAGNTIAVYLKESGHEVVGFAREDSPYVETVKGDAFNLTLLKDTIERGSFDVVINAIGMLNQFAENNKSAAVFLNAYLPHYLADITKSSVTQIIHMSTDCVFSGAKGNYTEVDLKDGDTFYDRSKALGELVDNKNLTLRNSIIGPDIKKEGIGLLNWFLLQKEEVKGFTKALWTGQTTLQLAKTMEAAAAQKATGLINMVPDSYISKYDLLLLFNKYFRGNELIIHPVDGICADKSLKRTNFDFDYQIPDYETMVAELANWMFEHKAMYPHYNLTK